MKVPFIALCGLAVVIAFTEGNAQRPVSVLYREERPMELTLEVSIGVGGDASVSITGLKADCQESWEKKCWTKSTRQMRLSSQKCRKLIDLIASGNLTSIPREENVVPGSTRVHLVANAEGCGKIDVLASLTKAGLNPTFRAIREAILQIAGPLE